MKRTEAIKIWAGSGFSTKLVPKPINLMQAFGPGLGSGLKWVFGDARTHTFLGRAIVDQV